MGIANYFLDQLMKKVDDVVVSVTEKKTNQIKFSENKIVSTKTWDKKDMDVFIASKKRIAVTSVESFSKEAVDTCIQNLIGFVEKIKKKKDYKGIAEGPFKYRSVKDTFDEKILNLGDGSVDLVEKGINAALDNGAKRCDGILEFGDFEKHLITSNGVDVEDKGTNIYFSIRTFVDKYATGHKVTCSRILDKLEVEKRAAEAAEIARKGIYPEPISSGKYDVVFSPLAIANILQNVGDAASIFSVESGLSFLSNRMNKKIASKDVTLVDDGSLANGYYSAKFDDEGVPTQKNVLINKGTLKTYLHNYSTAKKYNVATTANAGLISPETSNIVLEKGDYSEDELFAEVKKGLYITNLWYTRFENYAAGNFSTIPRDGAFFIDNGKIKDPVRGIRISENILNILKNIKAVGKERERIVGWEVDTPVVAPMVLAKNINISTSTH